MILIVGLGNPGEKYQNTRHNIGFLAVDSLMKKISSVDTSVWKKNNKFNSLLAVSEDLIFAKPFSFMNASGEVVKKIMDFYKIENLGLFVIHDDLDLPLGKIKISVDRGSAGHKGIESIITSLNGSNFTRIRVGIGKDQKIATDKYVLSEFKDEERTNMGKIIKKTVEIMEVILKDGAEKAANRYNN